MFPLTLLTLGYIAAVFAVTSIIGESTYHYWLLTLLSMAYMLAYLKISERRYWIPLSIVFFVTFAFPLAVLLLIGVPVYDSLGAATLMIFEAFGKFGQLPGFELLFPFLAVVVIALIHRRSESSVARKKRSELRGR